MKKTRTGRVGGGGSRSLDQEVALDIGKKARKDTKKSFVVDGVGILDRCSCRVSATKTLRIRNQGLLTPSDFSR